MAQREVVDRPHSFTLIFSGKTIHLAYFVRPVVFVESTQSIRVWIRVVVIFLDLHPFRCHIAHHVHREVLIVRFIVVLLGAAGEYLELKLFQLSLHVVRLLEVLVDHEHSLVLVVPA